MNLKKIAFLLVCAFTMHQLSNAQSNGWTLQGTLTTSSRTNKVLIGGNNTESSTNPLLIKTGIYNNITGIPSIRLQHDYQNDQIDKSVPTASSMWDISNNQGVLGYSFNQNPVFSLSKAPSYTDLNFSSDLRFSSASAFSVNGNMSVGTYTLPANTKFAVQGNSYFSGNVGIGTSTPTEKLDVVGNIKLSGYIDGGNQMRIFANANMVGSPQIIFYPFDSGQGVTIISGPTDGSASLRFCNQSGPYTQQNMIIKNNGYVGIGTENPTQKLHVAGNIKLSGDIDGGRSSGSFGIYANGDMYNGASIMLYPSLLNGSGGGVSLIAGPGTLNPYIDFCSIDGIHVKQNMIIKNNGYVGIGTGNPTSLLTVNGKIECEEIEVKDIAADYVFEKDYNLTKLNDLEKYIKQNKHLPGIAPASETEKGVNLGEFNEKILEKIEELTLYVIELKKENDELRAKLNENK